MAIIKCKMCGGDLVLTDGSTVATCEYCGTTQTVPSQDNEKKLTLFSRANRLRAACEFDKAAGIYEAIVADFPEEAEAYWGLVLCKYGIEYVDDPGTGKKIPTCHRSSFEGVLDDGNFEQALENADAVARKVYREEAKQIEEIRKGIIAVSANEDPYDIFICYKETDEAGNRTLDSVLAQDIYDALTDKGYRTFFARITLEDKLGQEYEPYIFAALNSAKIMLAVGTDYEYYNAVWVKNEWSRYLKLMVADKSKHLIPCFKGIDAYDMPREFAKLQAQDLGKMGAIQDILRGVEKLLPKKNRNTDVIQGQVAVAESGIDKTKPLLKRAFMFLEDGDWASADEYCEKVLDMDPEHAQAYLGKLMAELHVKKQDDLGNCDQTFDDRNSYQKAMRFADSALREKLAGYLACINQRIEADRLEKVYRQAVASMDAACSEYTYRMAAKRFGEIADYKDAAVRQAECMQKAESAARPKQSKKVIRTLISWVCVVAVVIGGIRVAMPMVGYLRGTALLDAGKYEEAIEVFQSLNGYMDSDEKITVCETAIRDANNGRKPGSYDAADNTYLQDAAHRDTISAGCLHNIALKPDGTVVSTAYAGLPELNYGQCEVGDWAGIVDIATKGFHTVGLKPDGTVVAIGWNEDGQCEVDDWTNIVDISTGYRHTVGLKRDGTVVAVGSNADGQCNVGDWTDIVAISAGDGFTIGLKADGTVVATEFTGNYNYDYGQYEVGSWTDIVAISAGSWQTVGLKADGTVVAAGRNDFGECDVEGWTNIVAISAGGSHTVGLRADGTVVAAGQNYQGECNVTGWTDIVAIGAEGQHTIGLKADGTVVAIGDNEEGQCEVAGLRGIKLPQ